MKCTHSNYDKCNKNLCMPNKTTLKNQRNFLKVIVLSSIFHLRLVYFFFFVFHCYDNIFKTNHKNIQYNTLVIYCLHIALEMLSSCNFLKRIFIKSDRQNTSKNNSFSSSQVQSYRLYDKLLFFCISFSVLLLYLFISYRNYVSLVQQPINITTIIQRMLYTIDSSVISINVFFFRFSRDK